MSLESSPLPVYVLIGGQSRRFGSPKATHTIDGKPWSVHVAERLAGGGECTLVGAAPDDRPALPIRRIDDDPLAVGPLSGLIASLRDRRMKHGPGWLVLASCDLVHPRREWLGPLKDAAESSPDALAVVYRTAEVWQPFPSLVHTRWAESLAGAIARGETALQRAFDLASAEAVPWPGDESGPPQANTPEGLERLL